MQEEKERTARKEVEWKAGKEFPLFKKDSTSALHTPATGEGQHLCIH